LLRRVPKHIEAGNGSPDDSGAWKLPRIFAGANEINPARHAEFLKSGKSGSLKRAIRLAQGGIHAMEAKKPRVPVRRLAVRKACHDGHLENGSHLHLGH
jgi:hypothetical protein